VQNIYANKVGVSAVNKYANTVTSGWQFSTFAYVCLYIFYQEIVVSRKISICGAKRCVLFPYWL